jgi:hypothetical protein
MGEDTLPILVTVGAILALVAGIFVWTGRATRTALKSMSDRVALLRPSAELAASALVPGSPVDLTARTSTGVLKLWLVCDVTTSDGRWSADLTIDYRIVAPDAGYRAASENVREQFKVGNDGDSGITSPKAKGILSMPDEHGKQTLQLLPLPACSEGSELFVRVAMGPVVPETRATFRVFVGVSAA